jgi:3-isopropylmalate/(R)-2-methylmalate dehydratase small subunit
MSENLRNITDGKGIPIRENDIDTDRIIPARYMKVVTFEGLGKYAFYDVRFDADGNPKDHPFNDNKYKQGSIMIVNQNFGCGSSREHAPQALQKYGITAIIGESFAEIFNGNCTSLGIPAVRCKHEDVLHLQEMVENDPDLEITIDLEAKTVTAGDYVFELSINEAYRKALSEGKWDSTTLLIKNSDQVEGTIAQLSYMRNFS